MKKLILFFVYALLFTLHANAQVGELPQPVGPGGSVNVLDLVGIEDLIYSALIIFLTYFSHLLPFLRNIKTKAVRALAIGITLLVFFVAYKANTEEFTVAVFLRYVIDYILATNFYDKILKPAGLRTASNETNVAANGRK
ncbi:MAG: hypothetical protein KatS3mg031_2996 [Chitinophagales bacterium]|nr:MAG: hypothetical protein KatS3mg031_2925 [Chitinophagales bacterium]GIV35461.1 MAG: hypothetical protein KatS3mg031_2996 [Chitinophagales bacterium]